jgi:uncharacterized protein DUF6894
MPRYYFDVRDNGSFNIDEIGHEFTSVNDARLEAARALGEIARDILPGLSVRSISIQVRDDRGPVLSASLRFEVNDQTL